MKKERRTNNMRWPLSYSTYSSWWTRTRSHCFMAAESISWSPWLYVLLQDVPCLFSSLATAEKIIGLVPILEQHCFGRQLPFSINSDVWIALGIERMLGIKFLWQSNTLNISADFDFTAPCFLPGLVTSVQACWVSS